jgi:hypothetical protein
MPLDGHAGQVPLRSPQLPIRYGHNVRRRSPTASGSITDFEPQISVVTFLGTIDSSADPAGGAPPEGWSGRF